jgi:hypothetical protein
MPIMNKPIFLVDAGTNIDKLQSTVNKFPNSLIFTLDYEIHLQLQKYNIPHELGENILTKDDFNKIDTYSINLTENCFKLFKNELTIQNIFLPELIEHELFQYFLIQFLKPYVILKILENYQSEQIFDFTNFHDFINKITNNLKIKHFTFQNNHTPNLYHDKIKFTLNLGKVPLNFEISRSRFSQAKKLTQKFIDITNNFEPKINSKKNILLVNFDPLEYSDLLYEFDKNNVNFFLLNTRKPAITNKKSLDIIKKSNSKILDLNKFYKFKKDEIILEKNLLEKKLINIFNNHEYFENLFSINNITFWNSIKNSLHSICLSRFNESIERIFLLNKVYELYDISIIFVWIDVGQEEKECILVGKSFSIESIMLQHGRFQTSKIWNKFAKYVGQFPSPLLSDKQIVWGNISKQWALSYNHKENNVIIGGSPRHDNFFNYTSSKSENGIILLATTGTMFLSSDSCTTNSQIKYDNYIREIYRIVKSLPNKKLVIKSHPSQILKKFVKDLIDEIDPSIELVENLTNQELFSNCEMLITFNNSTTTLEAMSLNTPVISLQTENWAKEDDIAQSDAIVSISKINDCEDAIKKILYDTEFKKSLLEKSQLFLKNYMSNPGNSSSSVVKLLKNLIN